jgi:uncharacterized protein YvpB
MLKIAFLRLLLFLIAALITTGCGSDAGAAAPTLAPTLTAQVGAATFTPQPSHTPLPPTPTAAFTPSPTLPEATPTSAPLPEEHYIREISGHRQYFTLGCEAATSKDWANYFGYDFNEFEFQYKLPLSDNPDKGFVGDVNAPWGQVPPYGYGVHAGPVADLLNAYGIPARGYRDYTLEQVKQKLAQDKPVIAWVIGNVVGGVPYEYTDSVGDKVIVAAYQHVVILTGYNATKIRYMTNGRFYETPNEVFLNSWGVLGNMVVVDE